MGRSKFLHLLVILFAFLATPSLAQDHQANPIPHAAQNPTQAEILNKAWEEMKLNFGNSKFQIPTAIRMGVGGGATWLGFHLERFSFEDAWIPITLSAVQVGAFNHLVPLLKRWYNSSYPHHLQEKRPKELQAIANFLVKGTIVFSAYNYLGYTINHLVDPKPLDLSSIPASAFLMVLSQAPWIQSFLRDAEVAPHASLEVRTQALQNLNLRIVILASLTTALNKLSVLQIDYSNTMQTALIAAGIAHYFLAPTLREKLQVKSLISAAVQQVSYGVNSCLARVRALGLVK